MDNDTVIFRAARAPRPEGEVDYTGPDGSRSAMLLRVGDPVTEPSGFGEGDWTYRIWTFAIDDQSEYDGQVLDCRTSTSTSTRSNQYKIMSALAGGDLATNAPASIRELVNRSCFIAIKTNDKDYPYIDSWMAIPQTRKTAAPRALAAVSAGPAGDEPPAPTQAPF